MIAELVVRGDPRVSPLLCLEDNDDDDEVSGCPSPGSARSPSCSTMWPGP